METTREKRNKYKSKTERTTVWLADVLSRVQCLAHAKLSLLLLLALDGSVDHEVGQVDVALGLFRLRHNTENDTDH